MGWLKNRISKVKNKISKVGSRIRNLRKTASRKITSKIKSRSRSSSSKVFISTRFKKVKNKVSRFVKGNRNIRNSKSAIKKIEPRRQSRSTILKRKTIFLKKPVENVREKKNIFNKLKSIKQKLVGVKRNYILPVGLGLKKRDSEKQSVLNRFFGKVKKGVGFVVKKIPLAQLINPNSQLKSGIGKFLNKIKQKKDSVKKKGIIASFVDVFKGEGSFEAAQEAKTLEVLEQKEQLSRNTDDQAKLIRNITLGGIGLLGVFLLMRKKS